MAIQVFIKRKLKNGVERKLTELLIQLRAKAMVQPGYISGKTLRRVDKAGEALVIGTWQSLDDWRRWQLHPERIAIQEEIDALLLEPTSYEIYEY